MAKALKGKVLFKIDTRQKERYAMPDGSVLEWQRGFEFNRRVDLCSMSWCIDGGGIPEGARTLNHHNATEAHYEIPPHHFLSQEEILAGWKVFSVDEDLIYAFKADGEWHPYKNFLITSRIFKKYSGVIEGIPTEQVKNRLLVVSGTDSVEKTIFEESDGNDLSGKVLVVTPNSDYEIIFHDTDNKEYSVIRTRTREILAIDEQMTKDVNEGKYMVGINDKTCKYINYETV